MLGRVSEEAMLLGVIADDFTGASDIANTLARGGFHLPVPGDSRSRYRPGGGGRRGLVEEPLDRTG